MHTSAFPSPVGKHQELELQQFEKLNQTLFHNHPDGFYLLDLEGNLISFNQVVCELVGIPREVLLGASYEGLIHPEYLTSTIEKFNLCVQDLPQRYITVIVTADGEKYLDVTNFPYKVDNQIIAIFGIAKDITHYKQIELELIRNAALLKAQNEELNILRKIIAHDIRRPVANAIGFSKLLEGKKLPSDKEAEVKMLLRKSVESVDVIVRDLNEVISLKAIGEEAKESVRIDISVKKLLEFFGNEISSSKASVTINLEPDLAIYTIKPYLQSILRNLFSNALKYRASNKVPSIHVQALTVNDAVQISVKDNGIGMDLVEVSDNLFKMHKRFAPSIAEGNGLGLYIVNEQVKILGGTIAVLSEPGSGSEFIVNLPL